jgi:seryl-tRNA synthetase
LPLVEKFALRPRPVARESRRAMLDIRVIRENPALVQDRLKNRGGDHWKLIDDVLACDESRRKFETEKQQLQNSRKTISKQIGQLKAKGEDTSAIEAEVRGINEQIAALDVKAEEAAAEQSNLLLNIPNLTHDACPVGSDETANPVVREWGSKPEIAEPKDHVELALQHPRGWFRLCCLSRQRCPS